MNKLIVVGLLEQQREQSVVTLFTVYIGVLMIISKLLIFGLTNKLIPVEWNLQWITVSIEH